MRKVAVELLILSFILLPFEVAGQSSYKTVSLRKVGIYATRGTDKTIRIQNVILEEVHGFENDWAHLFQVYDPRARFRRGAFKHYRSPGSIPEFSIFADEGIGKVLIEQKAEWFNRKVNIYLDITDRGLTPWIYIGYVVKVERLNAKGKADKTVP